MASPQLPVLPDLPGNIRLTSVWEKDPHPSRLTGKPLRRVELELFVQGDDNDATLSAALSAASGDGPLLPDSSGGAWKVGKHSRSYVEGQAHTRYSYCIELEEYEQLNLHGIELAGMTLVPERWKLVPNDDAQALFFLATLDPESHQLFESHIADASQQDDPYFPVTLLGANDEPLRMRFGRCLWQRLNGGSIRYRAVLIFEEDGVAWGSDNPFDNLLQPEFSRTAEIALTAQAQLGSLVEELKRSGVLDDDAIGRIEAAARELPRSVNREFDRTNDVESFFD